LTRKLDSFGKELRLSAHNNLVDFVGTDGEFWSSRQRKGGHAREGLPDGRGLMGNGKVLVERSKASATYPE
jgi:hypothetical protein